MARIKRYEREAVPASVATPKNEVGLAVARGLTDIGNQLIANDIARKKKEAAEEKARMKAEQDAARAQERALDRALREKDRAQRRLDKQEEWALRRKEKEAAKEEKAAEKRQDEIDKRNKFNDGLAASNAKSDYRQWSVVRLAELEANAQPGEDISVRFLEESNQRTEEMLAYARDTFKDPDQFMKYAVDLRGIEDEKYAQALVKQFKRTGEEAVLQLQQAFNTGQNMVMQNPDNWDDQLEILNGYTSGLPLDAKGRASVFVEEREKLAVARVNGFINAGRLDEADAFLNSAMGLKVMPAEKRDQLIDEITREKKAVDAATVERTEQDIFNDYKIEQLGQLSKNTSKLGDGYYEANIRTIADKGQRTSETIRFINQTKYIPEQVGNEWRALAAGGSVEATADALEMYAEIQQKTGTAVFDYLADKETAFMKKAHLDYMIHGDAEFAVKLTREFMDVPKPTRDSADAQMREYRKENPTMDWLEERLDREDPVWTSDPNVASAAFTSFQHMTSKFNTIYGGQDPGLARELGWEAVRGQFSVTKVGGSRNAKRKQSDEGQFMKFAPEATTGFRADEINKQLKAKIDVINTERRDTQLAEIDFETVYLMTDATTEKQSPATRTWMMVATSPAGDPVVLGRFSINHERVRADRAQAKIDADEAWAKKRSNWAKHQTRVVLDENENVSP